MSRLFAAFLFTAVFSGGVILAQDAPEPDLAFERASEVFFAASSGGFLGVGTKDVSKDNMAEFGLSSVMGVAVTKVLADSPAEKAGILKGDVITSFNGEKVTSVRQFNRMVREVAPDHTVRVEVVRNGTPLSFDATLASRKGFAWGSNGAGIPEIPSMPRAPRVLQAPGSGGAFVWNVRSRRQIGVGVSTLTKQLGEYFGVPESKGILISEVKADSPAAKAGLRAGDVIVAVDGESVAKTGDLVRQINQAEEGDVRVSFYRNGEKRDVSVTPEKGSAGALFDGDFDRIIRVAPGMIKVEPSPPTPPTPPAPPAQRDN